jgi:arabinan endo-1,5-alpha-L-arabinosidase
MTITAVYSQSEGGTTGDVNSDRNVSAADLVLLSKFLLGTEKNINSSQADLYPDNRIDVYDMILLRKLLTE